VAVGGNSVKRPKTTKERWDEAQPEQKSFLVRVLNHFHYRRPQLKQSWYKEEVLTWELTRGWDLLPANLFLGRSLTRLLNSAEAMKVGTVSMDEARAGEKVASALKPLLDAIARQDDVSVTAQPSLSRPGRKTNSCSDIGIGLKDGQRLWFEAKTVRTVGKLNDQIDAQQDALLAINAGAPTAVVALVPHGSKVRGPMITWDDVRDDLMLGRAELLKFQPGFSVSLRGYALLAGELIDRIGSHPNRICSPVSREEAVA